MEENFPNKPSAFIWYQIKSYKFYSFGFLIVGALWAADLAFRPYLLKMMLDRLEKFDGNLFHHLAVPAGLYIFLSFFINAIFRVEDYLRLKVFPDMHASIILQSTKYTQQHSHSYFQNQFGGSIVSRITDLAKSVSNIVEKMFIKFYCYLLAIISCCIALSQANKGLTYILIGWTVIFIIVSYQLAGKAQKISYQVSKANVKLKGRLIDSIGNMLAVRIFGHKDFEYRYISKQAYKKKEQTQALWMSNLKQKAFMETFSNILITVVIVYLIYMRQRHEVTIGDFAFGITVSLSLIGAIWNIAEHFLEFSEDLGIVKQTLEMIAIPHEILDSPNATELQVQQGGVDFKNVLFQYKNTKPLFEDLSVKIEPQQKVGLVGYSGSGKTTFANLLIRLFNIAGGQILIDDQDIKEVTQNSLHQNITYIPQEPLLFHRSIMENIMYGYPDATEQDVITAAIHAHAHEFISELPEGYHALVGERGVKLSGGQRQRIAIARAIIKNSKILVLDEATSALDSLTEFYIQQSLKLLMQNKTVLVIAHRLSTILEMDRILVFENGRIIQDGPPRQLMYEEGLFKQLLNMQSGPRDII